MLFEEGKANQSKKLKLDCDQNMEGQASALDTKALNKFSRQNAALGADTTAKLIKMKVLIVGLRGVGVETAKNLALQGVGAITLIDGAIVQQKDLGVNFFITEEDISKKCTRAAAVAPRLQELNTLCTIMVHSLLTPDVITQHTALVLTEPRLLSEFIALDNLCRTNKVSFLYALTCGVSTSIFVDHSSFHVVNDPNGEKPVQKLITEVSKLSATELLVRYDHPAGQLPEAISSGAFEVTDVVGVSGINHQVFEVQRNHSDPVKTVRITIPPTISIDSFPYISGGMLTEKKIARPHPMASLEDKIKNPGSTWDEPQSLVLTDLLNIGSETQQHVAFVALLQYVSERVSQVSTGNMYDLLPPVNNDTEAKKILEIAKKLLLPEGKITLDNFDLDEAFVLKYALYAGVELQPMSAFTGGVLAQEVVKCTGKFTPIPGFMHFSAFEVLPTEKPTVADTQPRGTRYDELAAVFGWPFIEKLGNLKYFMVGCGALGCEFVKNFALNGICCGPDGKLIVTDADRIELSNLTRQFLFREHNVGHLKSKAAGAMATKMNKHLNIEALEMFVGVNTENVFDDRFWLALDGVCNALDNMEARRYVDTMCVKYEKSLLESGTMGTSGNVDTICPFKTQTYSDGGNAAEGGQIPMCTLRNFPQITDHCIEWARDQFALLFTKLIKNTEMYLKTPDLFHEEMKGLSDTAQAIFIIRSVTSITRAIANPVIQQLTQVAFDIFHFLFRDRILDLQNTFPMDKRIIDKNGVDKGPFWGEKKRYPATAGFNIDDETHTSFIISTSCLLGSCIGAIPVKTEDDDTWCASYREPSFIQEMVPLLKVPEYVFSPVNTSDGADDEDASNSAATATAKKEELINRLLDQLHDASTTIKSSPVAIFADFEKDDDYNFHIAFVTAAANLRCDNYFIKRTNFHSCKVIAGKIIAAIATTTAAVCGLVILELFKLLQGKPTDSYMNRQIGLATNTYTSFTAENPIKLITTTEKTPPAAEETTPDMYDEQGKIKDEFIVKTVKRSYPENHTIWDKLLVPGTLTLKQFADWLSTTHNLKLLSWDFIIGYKMGVDEDGKKTGLVGVSSPVFPPKAVLDPSLLPALDLTLPQATQAIMRTATAKPTQEYIKLWKECKVSGKVDIEGILRQQTDVITNDTTLVQILEKMEKLGIIALQEKRVESRSITGLDKRTFWIIPSNESPRCMVVDTEDEVEHLASIKIQLSPTNF